MTPSLDIDLTMYDLAAVLRACHRFTDRYYVSLARKTEQLASLQITAKDGSDASGVAGEFSNALIEEQLRASIASETRVVRELIYRQAFVEADFQDVEP